MGILDIFKRKQYDMDTLNGINSIPVPAPNYNTGDFKKDCIYYLLQRKATEHKKNGNIELAIACLRKSNALSDYEKQPLLTQKDYFRLVKYIELTGNSELARAEEEKIYERHPEFKDRRISNIVGIRECLKRSSEYKNDFVLVSTNNHCPICSVYNLKVYSISGKSKKYTKLPKEITSDGGFCPNCYLSLLMHFDGINTPHR